MRRKSTIDHDDVLAETPRESQPSCRDAEHVCAFGYEWLSNKKLSKRDRDLFAAVTLFSCRARRLLIAKSFFVYLPQRMESTTRFSRIRTSDSSRRKVSGEEDCVLRVPDSASSSSYCPPLNRAEHDALDNRNGSSHYNHCGDSWYRKIRNKYHDQDTL